MATDSTPGLAEAPNPNAGSGPRDLLTILVTALLAVFALGQRHLVAAELGLPGAGAQIAPAIAPDDDAPLFADEIGASRPPAAGPLAPATASASQRVTPGPRAPERVLLLGDSMVEVLAPRLADYCLASGDQLKPAIWYASTTAAWAAGSELADVVREVDPTLVVIALGSSELGARDVTSREGYVKRIVRRLGGRKLVWVGPPNWREDTGINALLERTLGRDHFFRSAELELTRKADGIHPDAAGGAKWADAFVRWLAEDSAYRLAFAPPSARAPKIPARVFAPYR